MATEAFTASAAQQKDNLCGPFWAARVLTDAGIESWDGEQLDDDLVALHAGTLLPEPDDGPPADWDVGHFCELELLVRGPGGALVVVHDSYPSFGWGGRHLQPPRAVAAALQRGDGREGGVLAVAPPEHSAYLEALARDLRL